VTAIVDTWGTSSTDTRPLALVFAPVSARWDGGAFFASVNDFLVYAGYAVQVVDTVSLARCAASIYELALRWQLELDARGASIQLLLGNGLGGSVTQCLMKSMQPPNGTILISAPTICDKDLRAALAEIVHSAEHGRLREALETLATRVGATIPTVMPSEAEAGPATARIVDGLRLLLDLDVRHEVKAYDGPMRHIVGANSHLVTSRHVVASDRGDVVVIPGAGMRPHHDQPTAVLAAVADFLTKRREVCLRNN
jgi:pimeloyl-ACP methyl ester carboxylesterase